MTNKTDDTADRLGGPAGLLRRILTFALIGMAASVVLQGGLALLWLQNPPVQAREWLALFVASIVFGIVLLFALWLTTQGRNSSAAILFFGAFSVASVLVVVVMPSTLGLGLVAPAFSLLIALPYVNRNTFTRLSLISIGLVVLLIPMSALLGVGRPLTSPIEAMVQSLPLLVSAILVVALIWQMRDWLSATVGELRETRDTLETRVDERTREWQAANQSLRRQATYLESLHETALGIMNRQNREQLFAAVISRACNLFNTPHAFMALISDDGCAMVTHISRGFFLQQERETGDKFITHRGSGVVGIVWETGEPFNVDDYSNWAGRRSDVPVTAIKSVMCAPLKRAGEVIGMIAIAGGPDHPAFTKDDLDFLYRLAQLAAIAVDNTLLFETSRSNEKMLEQVVAERTAELSALLGVAQNLSATLELPALLRTIFQQLDCLVVYDAGTIFEVQGDLLITLHYAGPRQSSFKAGSNWRLSGHHLEIVRTAQPIIINDVCGDEPMARLFRETSKQDWLGEVPDHIVSWIGVPMKVKDRVIGILTLDSSEPNHFNQRHAELLMAVAQQAAMAIENARLYTQSVRSAAQAERSRLARDLHDSVSQAIYGIALASRTLEKLADPNDARMAVPLQHILSLSDAAMVEIRALIFELRPESLEREGVLAALNKQADAARARYGLTVHVNLCQTEPAIPLAVKEAIYRIAQEAMHNVIKHAHAREVWLSLSAQSSAFVLEVRDDGVGFDVNRAWAGQMGLGTMRERAQSVGGALQVESQPQQGATIRAIIPMRMSVAGT